MGVVGRCVSSGCGCKELYRFPHITYPYSALFCSGIHTFCSFFIMGHRLLINAVRNAIVICNIIGASLNEPQTYHTAVQNSPDIIL